MRTIIKEPKIPMKLLLFALGTIFSVSIRSVSKPMTTTASEVRAGELFTNLKSIGELEINNDFRFDSNDFNIIIEKIINEKRRVDLIKKENL